MGGQEVWLESAAMPSTTISLQGNLFGQALGRRHSKMPQGPKGVATVWSDSETEPGSVVL